LEEENAYLRQTLHLPPANRPPLGRGPTGKDRPAGAEATDSAGSPFSSSRDSSSLAGSPPPRRSTGSPDGSIPVSMSPSHSMNILDNSWDDSAVLLSDNPQPTHPSPMMLNEHLYSVSPMAHPTPIKSSHFASYTNAAAGPSRRIDDAYGGQHPHPCTQSSDRGSTTSYAAQHSYSLPGQDLGRSPYMQISNPSPAPFHHPQAPQSEQIMARALHHPQPTFTHGGLHQEQDHQHEPLGRYPSQRHSMSSVHAHDYPRAQDYPRAHFTTSGHPSPHMNSQARSQVTEYMPRASDPTHPNSISNTTRSPYTPDGRTHPPMS
jgi:hypothetical protein